MFTKTNLLKNVVQLSFAALLAAGSALTSAPATAQPGVTAHMVANRASMSIRTGGWQRFDLHAGVENAGRYYMILGSLSGTGPGIDVMGHNIPLNFDFYTAFTLFRPNAGLIQNQLARLNADGEAQAGLWLPAGLSNDLAGLEINHCYVVFDEVGQIAAVSNPVPLVLTD